jgi:UDP-N-acetyl-2-amino-2-deoxyglucuronate dehydrogenase
MAGFAVVGLGMGHNRAKLIHETDGAELRVVVDLNAELAEKVAAEFSTEWTTDLDEALSRSDVDVVMVMTPSGTHADLGSRAAKAGKHVITTKPMDVSTEACDRLIAACNAAGVLCGVDYQSRYVDNNFRVAEGMRQGIMGKPILGEVRFKWFRSQDYFEASGGWRGTWKMDGGGSLANQGAHLLDLLCWFMGDAESVYGETAIMNHQIETEDVGLAIVNFKSGAKGTVLGTTTFPESVYFSAEVHGTGGGILIDDVLGGKMRIFGEGIEEKLMSVENSVKDIVDDVLQALDTGSSLRVDGSEGRRTVELLEAIYSSAREGSSVRIG